ncbi:unnamed protein product [Rotaria magnacalcarata]|uniref:Uncharacterized protein n=1 Tax=Rotaria magnacalcarata TaxID=392030 RepID=A0A8S2QJ87_9BILA|nr:unnamed protein product [Rotaria magnacalcarata]
MPTKVITKKSSTASTTNNTSYISMMTPNVSSNTVTNNSMNRRRENSNGEDSIKPNLLYYAIKTPKLDDCLPVYQIIYSDRMSNSPGNR